MKLYYAPGTCALAVHTTLIWSELPYEIEQVELGSPEWRKINPMGAVPAIIDGDSGVLTQAHALICYIARKVPEKNLVGEKSPQTLQAVEQWLAFVNGDLHPAYMPIFTPNRFTSRETEEGLNDVKNTALIRLRNIFGILDNHLDGRNFMVGKDRTGADAFVYIMTRWLPYTNFTLDELPHLNRHFERFRDDSAVVRAEEEQGIRN
ncbi:MAG: glutathione S-transferase family protein [Gammaproteobacteria bacterium]|nr:glutathione S-transferase family protein [Gammaproteobacteria bacterium]